MLLTTISMGSTLPATEILSTDMLKRVTAICVVMSFLLPVLSAPAFAQSVLWAATSDHTDLIKDEEYEAAPVLMMAVPGLDDDASPLVEETDGGLEILYEEPGPPEPISVEEAVSPDLIGVKEEPDPELLSVEEEPEEPEAELEEIELEENTNGEIQMT